MEKQKSMRPTCEENVFIIEVSGLREEDKCQFEFTHRDDDSTITPLKPEGDKHLVQPFPTEIKGEQVNARSIYSWQWNANYNGANVNLTVPTGEGTLSLPLFNNVKSTQRQFTDQDYKLTAVVPLVVSPNQLTHHDMPIPMRQGYLYFFYQGRVWREVLALQNDGGMMFTDVDLAAHRDAQTGKVVATGKVAPRQAVGKIMPCIWLPERDNGRRVSLGVAYSEVQWSAEYINYLEANDDYRRQRFNNVGTLREAINLAPMRLRSESQELQLDNLYTFNADLSGEHAKNTYLDMQELEKQLKVDPSVKPSQHQDSQLNHSSHYALRADTLARLLGDNEEIPTQWQATDSIDYLARAKAQYWYGFVVDDALFDIRHQSAQVHAISRYLGLLQHSVEQNKYAKAAIAVNQSVLTSHFGEQENTLYKSRDHMDRRKQGVFNRTLRTSEREAAHKALEKAQNKLAKLLDNPLLHCALKDISALNDANACAVHIIAGTAFSALTADYHKLDALTLKPSSKYHKGQDVVLDIMSEDSEHPLHRILFPPKDSVDLSKAELPQVTAANDGSGELCLAKIAQFAGDNLLLEADDITTAEMAAVSLELEGVSENDQSSFSSFRRVTSAAGSILQAYFSALSNIDKFKEAVVQVQFKKAYHSVSRNMKTFDPDIMGKMTVVSANQAQRAKGVILGYENANKRAGLAGVQGTDQTIRSGSAYDADGKLVLDTSKRRAAKELGGRDNVAKVKGATEVSILPEDSPLVGLLEDEATQKALKNIDDPGFNATNAYEKMRIPYFITMIEVWNVGSVLNAGNSNGTPYSALNIISATLDMSTASVEAYNFATRHSVPVSEQVGAGTLRKFGNSGRTLLSYGLVESLSVLKGFVLLGGLLTVAISIWDASRAFSANDDDAGRAAIATAAGVLMVTLEATLIKTSATFLCLGPIGWIGLALSVIGGVCYFIFKDSAVEAWLANGPFAIDEPYKGKFSVLQDPDAAYQAWMNLMVNLTVTVYGIDKVRSDDALVGAKLQTLDATHAVQIRTNIPMPMNQRTVTLHTQGDVVNVSQTHASSMLIVKPITKPERLTPIHIEPLNNTQIYFYRFEPKIKRPKRVGHATQWQKVRLAVRAFIQQEKVRYPMLSLEKQHQGEQPTSNPDFSKSPQPGWADEIHYSAN